MTDTSEVAISHLQRRKIEGRVLIPFIQTLREQLGEAAMRKVLDATIRKLAANDGAAWAETYGRTTASLRTAAQDLWAGGGALDVEVISESDEHLDFNVTVANTPNSTSSSGLPTLATGFTATAMARWSSWASMTTST